MRAGRSADGGRSRDAGHRSRAAAAVRAEGPRFTALSGARFPFKATALAERSAVVVASSGFSF